ncbi:hypothetical protein FisN_19Lh225 [Fistulifera solaris]|uniref:Prolyl endopeptidase-like n=1 Tax=Fistulifera solaris TaxID=1519565 RepID=A0A1Z5K7G8_FISSO|nr:hypothetical protein FisN_19Lh225 [Fistulifera solaris]|eukprot:GAX22166.1 hypothetical protein FisN_19Lh225 [Fistulifera solaris]
MHSFSRRIRVVSYHIYLSKRYIASEARQEAFYASLRRGDLSPSLLQWMQHESQETWDRFAGNDFPIIPVITSELPEIGPAGRFYYYWHNDSYYRRPVLSGEPQHLCPADPNLVHLAISPDETQLVRVFQNGSVVINSKEQYWKARAVEFGPYNSLYWIAHDGTVWRSVFDAPAECIYHGPSHPAMSLRRSKGGSAMLLENKSTTWVWQHREDGTISEDVSDTLLVDVHRDGQIVSLQSTTNDAVWNIYEMDLFAKHVVTYQRSYEEERHRIVIQSFEGQEFVSNETMIDPFSKLTPSGNMQYDTDILRFCLEKPYQPPTTYEFNMTNHHLETLARNFAPAFHNMMEERIYATSPDGTQVPITVFSHDKSTIDHVLLVGYGAYEKPAEWSYDPLFHYLLNQGVVVAYANIRNDKILGIQDFIAGAECMQLYGSVTAYGVSAGGVVVGASLQQAPHVFQSGIFVNALLDVEATLRNPDLYLTKEDWEEYGNPELDPSIASYCPVQNVSRGGPPVLVLATLDDDRAPYWNALIYTHKRGTESTHLYMEPSGGHTWNSDRQRMMALQASFVLHSH